jgi:uncharacterized protein (TIGR00255 family)
MSVYSMTGYASVVASLSDTLNDVLEDGEVSAAAKKSAQGSVGAELRSVNSRFLDLTFKLSDEFRSLEPAFRELISQHVKRGKLELRVQPQRAVDAAWPAPQMDQLQALARVEGMVQNWLPKAQPLSVHEVMQWCQQATPTAKLDEVAMQAVSLCVQALKQSRAIEGQRMADVLVDRAEQLRELVLQARPLVPQAVARQQERFMQRFQDALQSAGQALGGAVSEEAARDRALNESAAYALRMDVDEELARMGSHLEEIDRLLNKGGEVGKRLDFLIQELHREANTLGSKAAVLELSQIAVGMKVLIEQMREQVQNLE